MLYDHIEGLIFLPKCLARFTFAAFSLFLFSLLILFPLDSTYAQCASPLAAHSSCVGTAITNNNGANNGVRYADGSLAGLSGATSGFTRYNFAMAIGDTLRICGNSKIELTNATLKVIVVEAGSTLLLTNTSYSGAIISNYGTVLLGNTFNLNSPSVFINASLTSILDAQGNDINNSAKIVNNGWIKNVGTLKFNNNMANICLGDQSVIQTTILNNNSVSSDAFTSSGSGVGCVLYTGSGSGASAGLQGRCLTEDGTLNSDANISFCGASGSTIGSVTVCGATSNSVFGTALHPSPCSGCSSPLPITLQYFTASQNSTGVLLHWDISKQWDSDYFIVERSMDGAHWESVGIVQTDRETKGLKEYELPDYAPSDGMNYYLLSEVDTKGNKKEYAIAGIELEAPVGFHLFQDPISGYFTITIHGNYPFYDCRVYDMAGRILMTTQLPVGKSLLDLSIYSQGIYIVAVKVGHTTLFQKAMTK